jgi:hypothetical protein
VKSSVWACYLLQVAATMAGSVAIPTAPASGKNASSPAATGEMRPNVQSSTAGVPQGSLAEMRSCGQRSRSKASGRFAHWARRNKPQARSTHGKSRMAEPLGTLRARSHIVKSCVYFLF